MNELLNHELWTLAEMLLMSEAPSTLLYDVSGQYLMFLRLDPKDINVNVPSRQPLP